MKRPIRKKNESLKIARSSITVLISEGEGHLLAIHKIPENEQRAARRYRKRDEKRRGEGNASNWRANGNGIAPAMSANDFPRDSTSLWFAFPPYNTP